MIVAQEDQILGKQDIANLYNYFTTQQKISSYSKPDNINLTHHSKRGLRILILLTFIKFYSSELNKKNTILPDS